MPTSQQPQNLEAERAVLGSILIRNEAFWRVSAIVSAGDFFRDFHRSLFAFIAEKLDSGAAVDELTAREKFAEKREEIGNLTLGIPNIAQVEQYALIVATAAKLRRLVAAGHTLMSAASEQDADPSLIAAETMGALTGLATRVEAQAQPFGRVVHEAYNAAEKRQQDNRSLALNTGFYELDGYGVMRRTFIVVGSPSKHGKSAFAKDLAVGMANAGHVTAFLTLESTPEEISWRYTSSQTGIPHSKVSDWQYLGAADYERLVRSESLAQKLPLYITRSVRTIHAIDAEARRLKATVGLDALLIDYIQLVSYPQGPRDREERMAEISRWLLEIALDLEIAVIATSQVNKDRLERKSANLYPSDLKYAAAIGESARVVLMFQRPHVEDAAQPSCKVLFQVAAANEGRTGMYEMHFDETIQKFGDGDCAANDCRTLKGNPTGERLFA